MLQHKIDLVARAIFNTEVGFRPPRESAGFVEQFRRGKINELYACSLCAIAKIGIIEINEIAAVHKPNAYENFFSNQQATGWGMIYLSGYVKLAAIDLAESVLIPGIAFHGVKSPACTPDHALVIVEQYLWSDHVA